LLAKKKLEDAAAAFRKAIQLKSDSAEAHCNLGHTLLGQGRFADALAALRRGHELGCRRDNWPYPSAQWVRTAQRFLTLDAQLPKLLSGEAQPRGTAERLALAQLCQTHKKRYAAAARFYADTFATQPELADDLSGHRYDAACAAALAGCGGGNDAADLPRQERARLRRQALDWLRAELSAWRRALAEGPAKARPLAIGQMQHWLTDTDFAGVRGSEAIARLPQAERPAWRKLWADVADTLAAARRKAAPSREKESPAKE
jgi:serine/threonine-protein kinase